MMAFPARYQDQCAADCGISIKPGDMVRYDDDDEIVHVSCYIKAKQEIIKICPHCNMQSPCFCGED